MLRRSLGVLLIPFLAGEARNAEPTPQDEALLRSAHVPTDAAGLLHFLRKRVAKEGDAARLRSLVRQLGDESWQAREQASRELVAAGTLARGLLREALDDPDREVAWRAARCLAQIEWALDPEVVAAAVRALAVLKPAGSAEVLLGLLTATEDPGVVQEIGEALPAVTMRGSRPDSVLVHALDDQQPAVRAAAAEALARAGPLELRPPIRKLLHDTDLTVRCRTAQALLEARETDAVPVVIGLLALAPPREAGRIEESLHILAGETAPVTFNEPDRRKRQAAWESWWAANRLDLDLAHLDQPLRPLGFTLLAQVDSRGGGEVLELDALGRVRWQINGLAHPIDVQVLAQDRILISEYASRRVSERNLKGEVLWEKTAPSLLLAARRLSEGRTFLVMRDRLMEMDSAGKPLWSLDRPSDIASACRQRDGQVVVVTSTGTCVRYDARHRQVKSFPVGVVLSIGTQIDCLPGGHVLVPIYSRNQVVEYDSDGRVIWSALVARPNSVQRLPNGNTLVCSRLSSTVVELDREGLEVWRYRSTGRPLRAMRR
jgi:HEAT repeat protein